MINAQQLRPTTINRVMYCIIHYRMQQFTNETASQLTEIDLETLLEQLNEMSFNQQSSSVRMLRFLELSDKDVMGDSARVVALERVAMKAVPLLKQHFGSSAIVLDRCPSPTSKAILTLFSGLLEYLHENHRSLPKTPPKVILQGLLKTLLKHLLPLALSRASSRLLDHLPLQERHKQMARLTIEMAGYVGLDILENRVEYGEKVERARERLGIVVDQFGVDELGEYREKCYQVMEPKKRRLEELGEKEIGRLREHAIKIENAYFLLLPLAIKNQ